MSSPRRSHPTFVRVGCVALLLAAPLGRAQAPLNAEQAWPIPEVASRRAASMNESGRVSLIQHKSYDLPGLLDLAERTNPETRAAWEVAREAAAAIGLVESEYLPQLSFQAIGGLQHTPLPAPKNLVPAGYFVSDSRELIPALAIKWLLFDFGRREALLEGARADSFVANVAFHGHTPETRVQRFASIFRSWSWPRQAARRTKGIEYGGDHARCRVRQEK